MWLKEKFVWICETWLHIMTSDILSLQQTSGWRHWEYGHHGGLWRWDDVIFLQLNQRFDSFDVITFASFFCLKRSIISSHRVSNWENPAVSHTLWWLKNSVKIIWSNVVMEKWLSVLCLFSHCAVAWWRRLLWRESHLHRHREHFVSSQLLTWIEHKLLKHQGVKQKPLSLGVYLTVI